MTQNSNDAEAIDRGRAMAARILERPQAQPATSGDGKPILLALGDSWFNYWPRGDILDTMENVLQLRIERHAAPGRKLAEMLYAKPSELGDPAAEAASPDGAAITWLVRRLAALKPAERPRVTAILVSAGGNDVAGNPEVLRRLVAPRGDGTGPRLDTLAMRSLVDGHLRSHYATLLACITQACDATLQRRPTVLLHGYAWPVADGRGALGRSWLRHVLEDRGYAELDERRLVMQELIDRLNEMQRELIANQPDFAHATHVDLRAALSNGADHKVWWQNELHPTIPLGFAEASKRFIELLRPPTPAA